MTTATEEAVDERTGEIVDEQEPITLTTLRGGAAIKLFDEYLQLALANIKDERTGGKPRKVVLTISLAPVVLETAIIRDELEVAIEADAKLAPVTTGEATHRVRRKGSKFQMHLGL